MKKVFSILAAIVFFVAGVYLFYKGGDGLWSWEFDIMCILFSVLPFGLSVLFLMLGVKSGKKTNEGESEDAEKKLESLFHNGVISEEEYQQKLRMLKSGVQKSMNELKSLKDAGIITEEEYQPKMNQLLK